MWIGALGVKQRQPGHGVPVTKPSLIQHDSTDARIPFWARKRSTMSPSNDNYALISLKDTCTLTSMSKTMIHRLRGEGRFPAAVALGEKRIAFLRKEVIGWIEQRLANRAA